MPKKKSKDTQAAQSRRFVETAKTLGVDESGKAFDRAVKVVVMPSRRRRQKESP